MLEVKKLTKRYGSICSVNDVTFSVGQHEVVGLLGPNGAGKSTTMRMLTGYLPPTSGCVSILGEDVFENPLTARRSVGYLPELPPLYLSMTVEEQLKFVCDLRGIRKKDREEEVRRVCRLLHIDDVIRRPVRNLSKGYRQRVGFAGALVGGPGLLILDEPTVGLDPRQILEIRDLIQVLSKDMTVILSSHILTEISSVCNRILIMNKGRLVADGTSEEIERRFGGRGLVEVAVRGDRRMARDILDSCLNRGALVQELPGNEAEAGFLIQDSQAEDVREPLFQAFAAHAEELSLVTLRPMQKSLEEIFMEITRGEINDSIGPGERELQ